MVKICFICSGNTCRSVMAERLMKRKLKEQKITDNIKITSKGINAKGDNINDKAKDVLKKFKALASNRKSVKLGKIDKETLYIVMTENMKPYVKAPLLLSARDLIGTDILDPFGQSEEVYLQTAKQIIQALDCLIEKIKIRRGI